MDIQHEYAQMCLRYSEMCDQFHAQQQRYQQWVHTYTMDLHHYLERKRVYAANMRATHDLLAAPQSVDVHPVAVKADHLPEMVACAPWEVTDAQWSEIVRLLQRAPISGRSRTDERHTLNGILFVLYHQCPWRAMPKKYGSFVTCWRRLLHWQNSGVWPRIARIAGCESPELMLVNHGNSRSLRG